MRILSFFKREYSNVLFLVFVIVIMTCFSCSYEKRAEREGYRCCDGTFEFQGGVYSCGYEFKSGDLAFSIRIIPLNVSDRGFVHKGPFKVIMVVNSEESETPDFELNVLELFGYVDDRLVRKIKAENLFIESDKCTQLTKHCNSVFTLFENVDLLVKDNEIVYLKILFKANNIEKELIFKFLPYVENRNIEVPLLSS